jgi:hypothetical protein
MGLQVDMAFQREGSQIVLETRLSNATELTLTDFAVQFNKNTFAVAQA